MKKTKAWSVKMRLALLALAALVWIAVPVSARAEGTVDVWDGSIATEFARGDGSEDNPYQISSAEELAYLAQQVNGGTNYMRKYFMLTTDINLDGKEWTPIGTHENSFQGNFDGNGYTVTGMLISGSPDYAGLFGQSRRPYVQNYIKNVTVENSVITGKAYAGAVVGDAVDINIENCRSMGNTIESEGDAGGICGYFGGSENVKISQCYNSSRVTGEKRAGGIAGRGDRCAVENCLNTGEITVSNISFLSATGGIFGTFHDVKASASITACVNLGKVSGGEYYGGIVGKTETNSAGRISNCYYKIDAITGGFDAGTALKAGQLCGALPSGLDSEIWEAGSVDIGTAVPTHGRFGTATGTYINLQSVAATENVKTNSAEVYNFATTGSDADWDTYTRITTAEEFAAIGRDDTKWSGNYVLGNNIDVSGVQLRSIGDPENGYTGKFSGDGHTISRINMTGDCWGLFGGMDESSKVMLLAANGVIDSTADAVGGICGCLSEGEIYGCSFIGTVKGAAAGGICAQGGLGKISQCFFSGEVQGRFDVGGISGGHGDIDHCISIGIIKSDRNTYGGITYDGERNVEKCYFNKDICKADDEYGLGRSTLLLTSSTFFDNLIKEGFDPTIWTKKANDKETGTAYYPSLGENNAVSVDYTTGLQFERADDAAPTYRQDITFNVKALVNFVTDGQPIPAEDTDGSFEIRIGDTTVVSAADIKNGTATYKAQTVGETTFTLVYTGTNSSFFPEQTTKDLTVNIDPAVLTVDGVGVASGIYGTKLSDLTVNGLTAKLGNDDIDGTWQIQSDDDKVPYVGDSETYTATFIPEHPEYYQPLTAQVTLEIEKARAPKIDSLNLEYSWAAKGERAVQIPGLPDAMGETTMNVEVIAGLSSILATDSDIKYSEGKLLFTLGENTMEDIGQKVLVTVRIHPQNYGAFYLGINIFRTAKSDREAPASDAFDMAFTVSGNDLAAEITTDLADIEYSFDGTDFGPTKATRVDHDEKVTAWMRYAETDDYNASPAIAKTWNSGHGTLTHHDRVEPNCQAEGSIEYWTCDVCGLYFATADGSERITAAETVLPKTDHSWSEDYLSDMTGHWHKCSVCGATTNTESHISGGAATTEQAEICTVCGYEIAPKKPADNNNGNDNTGDNGGNNTSNGDNGGSNTPGGDNNGSDTPNGDNNGTVSGNDANSNTGSSDSDDDDDDQTPSADQKPADAGTSSAGGTTNSATAGKPSTPGAGKPSVTPVTPTPTTPAADEGRKDDAAKPSGEAQDTQEAGGDASQEERTDSMTAQTSGTQEPGTEQLTETSGKGTNAGRVAAAAAAGTVAVGGGGAAIYVTIKKGRFKFK